jgi:quercetin dioxygenase-like cupin family protein
MSQVLDAPEGHKILLENDRVRVLEVRIKPNGKSKMHSHPPNVIISLSNSKIKMKYPDSSNHVVELKNGDTIWSDGDIHEIENIGTTDDYAIIVELKNVSIAVSNSKAKRKSPGDSILSYINLLLT